MYHWSSQSRKVSEITAGNRKNLSNPTDPGGRLGPQLDSGDPDLRNLEFYACSCQDDDLLIMVSDGVHDNIDPQQLGIYPLEFNIEASTWEEAEMKYPNETSLAKTNFATQLIGERILYDQSICSNPQIVTQKVLEYVSTITKDAREFMQNHPNDKQPRNIAQYPGKMDHTTCVTIRVGES